MNGYFPSPAPRDIPHDLERDGLVVGERHGFVSREPQMEPAKRNRPEKVQLQNMTMRLAIRDATRFVRWCERERMSYREGFSRLLASAKVED